MHNETEVKILILGVGNILLRDEGIGPYVIRELEKETLPAGVAAIDAGTQVMDVVLGQVGVEKLIIVDVVAAGGPPGSVYRFTPEDISQEGRITLSLHQATLLEALTILQFQGRLPREVIIFGVQPKTIAWGLEPSDELLAKIPVLIELIKEEIKKEEVPCLLPNRNR